jgi:hypothetical protein
MELFKSNRADIFKGGMPPDPVIEAFHKLEDGLLSQGPCLKARQINALALKCSEERLHGGIIPTVAYTAHTHGDTNVGEECLIRRAGGLASSIRMVQ